jgi:hypothetical protein
MISEKSFIWYMTHEDGLKFLTDQAYEYLLFETDFMEYCYF